MKKRIKLFSDKQKLSGSIVSTIQCYKKYYRKFCRQSNTIPVRNSDLHKGMESAKNGINGDNYKIYF